MNTLLEPLQFSFMRDALLVGYLRDGDTADDLTPITVLGVGQWWLEPALILIQVLVLAWTAYVAVVGGDSFPVRERVPSIDHDSGVRCCIR